MGQEKNHSANDAHRGSEAIRKFIAEKQPKIVYHGQVHENWAGRVGDVRHLWRESIPSATTTLVSSLDLGNRVI